MKNLKNIDCFALTPLESQQINGGVDKPKSGFWLDLAYLAGAAIHGLVVFGTEGGRNAGICVR
jgi:hypothetical protein